MLLEFTNIIYILTILIIVKHYFHIKPIYFFVLTLHLPAIYLFNGVLFPPSYMPDQFGYLSIAQNLRDFDFDNPDNVLKGNAVLFSGIFFSIFPIPFISSFYSIAMINFLLYVFVFMFMYKKNFLKSKLITWFYLLYPSLLLYSSVALRDMLIFSIMFFGTYFILVKKNSILGSANLFVFSLIKFQNLLIFILALFFSSILKKQKHLIDFIIITSLLLIVIIFSDYFSIERINFYRSAFYYENIQKSNEIFIPLNSYYDLFFYSIPDAIKFMFRPLPWQEAGIFQYVQFLENCCIFILISHILYKSIKGNLLLTYEIKTLNLILILALIIYGLVTYNSGTAVRYKFPFIAVYIIFSYYFIHQSKKSVNA